MTIEPVTVWVAYATFVLGVVVGALLVQSEANRARRRWREAMPTWPDVETVAAELRDEHKELPRHNAPDMVAAIRQDLTEQLKKRSAQVE